MKKITLFIFSFVYLSVYAQQWDWAVKSTNTTDWQRPEKICTDNNGHLYVLGLNNGNAQFDSTMVGTGKYLVKYSTAGGMMWARQIAGNPSEISCDKSGNVVIVGSFIGSITIDNVNLNSNGAADIYVLKIDSVGQLVWAKTEG